MLASRPTWYNEFGSIAEAVVDGFTKKYHVKRLVWFETHAGIVEAITREKQIKKWNRTWKINLVHETNPLWRDLFDEICG